MSVRLYYVSVIGLCYLCILQHFVKGAVFFPDTVYRSCQWAVPVGLLGHLPLHNSDDSAWNNRESRIL